MSINVQPEGDLFGLLVPEFGTLGATMTATTQAGPKPGGATPSRDTAMAIVTVGQLDTPITTLSALDDIEITTLEAGQVGEATVQWSYVVGGPGVGDPRSFDPPVLVSNWEFIDRSAVANKWTKPHAVRMPRTGRVVISATNTLSLVTAWSQDRFGKWTDALVASPGGSLTVSCLVPLSTGRLVCLYTQRRASSTCQIQMSYSDDGGLTWALGSSACLKTALGKASTAYLRIRAVELHGLISVLLWEQDTADTIYQYVSSDSGASLDLVETFSAASRACPDMAVHNGELYVATIEYVVGRAASTLVPYTRRLSSASLPLSSVLAVDAASVTDVTEWGALTGAIMTGRECALLADDDGHLWLYGVDHDATAAREVVTRVSRDGGVTWTQNFKGSHVPSGTVLYKGDTTTYLLDLTVAPERGRAILAHRSVANATADDSLCAAYLGRWSTVGMPEDADVPAGTAVAGWDHLWIPIDFPPASGSVYTTVFSGAPTATLGSLGMQLQAAAGESAYYTAVPDTSSSISGGILHEFHVTVVSGNSLNVVRISDGTDSFYVMVTVTPTTVYLRDLHAFADLGSYAIDATGGVAIRIALTKGSGAWTTNVGKVTAWARADGPYSGAPVNYGPRQDQGWRNIASSTTLVSAPGTSNRVRWGVYESSSAYYRWAAFSAGAYTAGNISTAVLGTARGRILPGAESPIHLTEGLAIHGRGGPTVLGDAWTHQVAYEHPVEAVDPRRFPSPRRTHRTTTTATDHQIIWSDVDIGWRAGDLLGILVLGVNFPAAALYRDGAGTNKVADLDFRIQNLPFTRSRGQVIPALSNSGASAPFQFSEGTLRGAHMNLGGGAIRRVRGNQAGAWLTSLPVGAYASARAQLDSWDSGDAASGHLDLWMPGGFFLTEGMAATNTLMLRTPKTTTAEGYFEYGTILIGRVRILKRPAWGRSVQWTPAYALNTAPSGARSARSLGPTRRSVEIAWDDGIDTTALHVSGAAPDWYTSGYAGADAVAAPADTPRTLGGILSDCDGARLPVGYLPAIPQLVAPGAPANAPYRDLDPHGWLYGRILTETLRMDTVLGDEQASEYVKGGMVRVEEEV